MYENDVEVLKMEKRKTYENLDSRSDTGLHKILRMNKGPPKNLFDSFLWEEGVKNDV